MRAIRLAVMNHSRGRDALIGSDPKAQLSCHKFSLLTEHEIVTKNSVVGKDKGRVRFAEFLARKLRDRDEAPAVE
jgi:hypothetical protein